MVCGSLDLSQGVLKVYAFTRETASSHCSIPLGTVTLIVWGSFERGLREPGAARPERYHLFSRLPGREN
jgi:hypothetical protein